MAEFSFARCELCGQYVFETSDAVAFRRRDKTIEYIGPPDEELTSGMGCVCRTCVAVIAKGEP